MSELWTCPVIGCDVTEDTSPTNSLDVHLLAHGARGLIPTIQAYTAAGKVPVSVDTLGQLTLCALNYNTRLPHGTVPPEVEAVFTPEWIARIRDAQRVEPEYDAWGAR